MDRIENAQMNSQGTRKLYYENVMECVPDKEEGYYRIVLDASAFFPEEGGQSADKGTLNGQEVLDVSIKQGILYHKVACEFPVSTRVTGHVDWNRRFDFMQQHSGEHMISGLLHSHFGLEKSLWSSCVSSNRRPTLMSGKIFRSTSAGPPPKNC